MDMLNSLRLRRWFILTNWLIFSLLLWYATMPFLDQFFFYGQLIFCKISKMTPKSQFDILIPCYDYYSPIHLHGATLDLLITMSSLCLNQNQGTLSLITVMLTLHWIFPGLIWNWKPSILDSSRKLTCLNFKLILETSVLTFFKLMISMN